MLSPKFIEMIESHSGQIAAKVLAEVRRDPKTTHLSQLPRAELDAQCSEIVRHLGHWLADSREEEVAERFENYGRLRRRERVPIHESVHALHLLKAAMIDFIRNQGLAQTSVDLYAEEELEHQVGLLFDSFVYHLIRGSEAPLSQAVHAAG